MAHRLNRRTLVKGTAGAAGALTLASSAYHVPNIIARQEKAPVLLWTASTADSLESQQRIVDEFNAQSEDVAVTLEQIPPGEVTDSAKLITAVRGGTGPDVYFLDRFIVAERAANGLLQDLTQLLEDNGADPALGDHIGFAAAEATYNGAPFALPFDTDVRALYYNIDLLNAAGIDPEPFDAANGPMTWDAFKEAITAANTDNESGDNFAQMGFVPYFNQAWHYTYGFSWGADFFDEDACEVTPNTEEMIAAAQFVYDWCAEMDPAKVQAFIQAAMRPGAPPQESPWTQGRLASMVTGDWQIASNVNYAPDMEYGITYIPTPTEGGESATWAGGWSMVIPQGAKEPDAAIKFMLYACGEPGQRIYTEDTAHVPTLLALQEDASLFDDRHRFFVDELLPTTNNRPPLPVGAKYWDELTAAWQKIYLNEEEPEPALTTAKDNTMTLLGPFCPIG
jgi:multiple sugar transport system substrate-binding protein